ncbi:transcription initiation factor TFIIA small subunit [Zalerion maritima]|uniref:Transcription initiation factor IIA subunit 2 n=1 Tax=Zalerion maritima TaxID=339359 RepID=A0AAD5RRZ4_9PEZI|nr:transcription initiation factor TFIIA small subunit [Zalerion maritima]
MSFKRYSGEQNQNAIEEDEDENHSAKEATEEFQIYRHSSIGEALVDTLDDLIMAKKITPQIATRVLTSFDQKVPQVLQSNYAKQPTSTTLLEATIAAGGGGGGERGGRRRGGGGGGAGAIGAATDVFQPQTEPYFRRTFMTVSGHLDTYRFLDEVWTFEVENPDLRMTDLGSLPPDAAAARAVAAAEENMDKKKRDKSRKLTRLGLVPLRCDNNKLKMVCISSGKEEKWSKKNRRGRKGRKGDDNDDDDDDDMDELF